MWREVVQNMTDMAGLLAQQMFDYHLVERLIISFRNELLRGLLVE